MAERDVPPCVCIHQVYKAPRSPADRAVQLGSPAASKFPDSFEFAPPIFSGPQERPPWTFGPQFVRCQADGPIKRTSFKTPQGSILKPVKMLEGGDGHFEEIGALATNCMDAKTWIVKICGRADYELERLEGAGSRSLFELIELGYSPRIPLCAKHNVAKQPMKHPDLVIMEEKLEGKGGEAQDVGELARRGREEESGKAIELDSWPSKEEEEVEDEEMLCSLFADLQRANRGQRQGAAQAPAAPAAPATPAAPAARQSSPTTASTTSTTASQTGPRASAFSQSPGPSSSSTSRMRQVTGTSASQPATQPSPSPTTTVKADSFASGVAQLPGPSSSAPVRKIAPRPTPRAAAPATTIKSGLSLSGASQSPSSSFLSTPTRRPATQPTPAATRSAAPITKPAATPATTSRRTPIVQPVNVDCRAWLMKCIWFGKDRVRSPKGNGNCGYQVIGCAVGMEPDDIRFLLYDWIVNELRKFWPDVRDEVIEQIKRSIFVDGIRGNKGVAEGKLLPEEIWLSRGHLGFLAQIFGRLFCAYDLEDADGAATYAPVEDGDVEAEPICLAFSHNPGHWVEVQRKEFPLPPLDYSCWGRQREHFLAHARSSAGEVGLLRQAEEDR